MEGRPLDGRGGGAPDAPGVFDQDNAAGHIQTVGDAVKFIDEKTAA